jgi:prepilin-type N-terminal cleavage/methylation domain-containing protein
LRNKLLMTRGFTLIELMVSLLIFALVVIGVYFFFDQGQWLYLESERKSRIQEMGRIAMEQMERDFRMIGAGVPSGTGDDGVSVWTPAIFDATVCTIGFTGDIDNGTDELSHNTGTDGDNHIFIGENTGNEYYISRATGTDLTPDLRIVLVSNGRNWEDLIATGLYSTEITPPDMALETSTDVTGTFLAVDSTVHTLERVFYRMINQSGAVDANGVCNDLVPPYCTIQRQEFTTNNPAETDPETEAAAASWETLAQNVTSLQLSYLNLDGTAASPASAAVKIRIQLTVRDRARRAGTGQNIVLRTVALIRNRRL